MQKNPHSKCGQSSKVGGSEFQTLTTLSAKNWLRAPLLQCDFKSFMCMPSSAITGTKLEKIRKICLRGQKQSCSKIVNLGEDVAVQGYVYGDIAVVEHKSWTLAPLIF